MRGLKNATNISGTQYQFREVTGNARVRRVELFCNPGTVMEL
jgi:hypothetical protein